MLTCQPKGILSGIFSRSYQITEEDQYQGNLRLALLREQAKIQLQERTYRVSKIGFFSSHWILSQDNQCIATAIKPDPFYRRLEIVSGQISFELIVEDFIDRQFNIFENSNVIGTIAFANPFTRRTTIECSPTVPVHLQLFALSLTIFMWRRTTGNNP